MSDTKPQGPRYTVRVSVGAGYWYQEGRFDTAEAAAAELEAMHRHPDRPLLGCSARVAFYVAPRPAPFASEVGE